ncbi:MAG: type I-B CRISPR-associated protein Cas5b [Candidatus Desulfofervidaceae bacterium]|nr:type I-B CRISPR-associated protein Cas5b [Candidatus Desulfofervidaceae bacterium]
MGYIDRLLIFDLTGKMAHFRVFYTNSSSLSYTFPPRTTITGLIAGILGYDNEFGDDPYYEKFASSKCKIALSVKRPVRKVMQKVNYVRTKNLNEIDGSAGSTGIPLEILLPNDLKTPDGLLQYRIYFYHEEDDIFDMLTKAIINRNWHYPPYMGISEFIADVEFVALLKKEDIRYLGEREAKLNTVVNTDLIQKASLHFVSSEGKSLRYLKEKMPLEFDNERRIKATADFIYEVNTGMAYLKIKEACEVTYNSVKERIAFMEG